MRRFYIAIIGGVAGLFLYAGATGNWGVVPRLSLETPFARHPGIPAQMLSAPLLLSDMSGPTGVNVGQFVRHLENGGAKLSWERGADQVSWIMRYSMRNELTDADFSGAGRLKVIPDASSAGIHGQAAVFSNWAEDGEDFTLNQTYSTVLSITSAIRQGR